jgi:transcriptional regulator NrdR family protein
MSLLMDEKKAKKKAQLKRNRHNQEIFQALRLRELEADRVQELEEKQKPGQSQAAPSEVWSAKVGEIRNRLTGKKRASAERWNRFSGTESGGGRGL